MNHTNHADLDRPSWAALTSKQAHLGYGDELARRYHPDVAPFAALAVETPAAYRSLGRLIQAGQQAAMQSLEPLPSVDGLQMTPIGVLYQMLATHSSAAGSNERIVRLGEADAPAMLALAQKTKPGPFGTRTHETGNYIGIRDGSRLIAMAGERMRLNGYVEISAVCVDDDYRGGGLAGRLMNALRREIEQRGEMAFLHVLSDNVSAIKLYERLGFEVRQTFYLTRVERAR